MKTVIWLIGSCLLLSAFVSKAPKQKNGTEKESPVSCNPDHIQNKTFPVREPWTDNQLLAPAALAEQLNDPGAGRPVVICVGPGALILGSLDAGPAKEKENLDRLKKILEPLARDSNLVIYCGCCPFEHCPNIRPAFSLLNEMKFTHAYLLNLEHNIKTDWVAKGYPSKS